MDVKIRTEAAQFLFWEYINKKMFSADDQTQTSVLRQTSGGRTTGTDTDTYAEGAQRQTNVKGADRDRQTEDDRHIHIVGAQRQTRGWGGRRQTEEG
jgi:hypothetical protein